MSWVAVGVGVGGSLIGGMMSSGAASDAADSQRAASAQSNALNYQIHRENTDLQMPAINAGNTARDRMMYLLGLSPSQSFSKPATTYEQYRDRLQGQYTTPAVQGTMQNNGQLMPVNQQVLDGMGLNNNSPEYDAVRHGLMSAQPRDSGWGVGTDGEHTMPMQMTGGSAERIDHTGLDAAIRAEMARDEAARAAEQERARTDPEYGRLSQQFQFDTYKPNEFSFSNEAFFRDPSYEFRLQQGQRQLDRMGAASGRFLSGSQLQASSNYNQGAASQEYQAAYNRAAGTFNTNETNRYNAFNQNQSNRFNAHQANFQNTINPLLSLSGSAQLASNGLMGANQNFAASTGANLMGAANASGAAGIAGANAINSGIGNAVSMFQAQPYLQRNNSVNMNPSYISAGNQAGFDAFGAGSNWFGTGG